jgi:hypothetical protein
MTLLSEILFNEETENRDQVIYMITEMDKMKRIENIEEIIERSLIEKKSIFSLISKLNNVDEEVLFDNILKNFENYSKDDKQIIIKKIFLKLKEKKVKNKIKNKR